MKTETTENGRASDKVDELVGSEMVQVMEITPAPTWDYDSIIVDASKSFATALEFIERVFDRQLDEIDEDPEEGWEGREVKVAFKLMRRDELNALMED